MRVLLTTSATAALAVALLAPTAHAREGDLVAISNNADGRNDAPALTGTVVRIDPTVGESLDRTILDRSGVAMAWSPTDDRVLAVQHTDQGAQLLVEIDPRTLARVDAIGLLVDADDPGRRHKVTALGFDDDGRLYGVSAQRTFVGGLPVPVGILVEIDPQTGLTHEIAGLGMPVFSRGGGVIDGDFLLVANHDRVDTELQTWRLSLDDGQAMHVGSTGIAGTAVGVAVRPDGRVWAALSGDPVDHDAPVCDPHSRLYDLDPRTGAVQEISGTGLDYLSGLAWMPDLVDVTPLVPPAGGTPDDALDALGFETAAVAEIRIGGRGRPAFDRTAPHTPHSPSATGADGWDPGEPIDLRLSWEPADDAFTLDLGDRSFTLAPRFVGTDLMLRGESSERGEARVVLEDLILDGRPLDAVVDSAGPDAAGGVSIVHVAGEDLVEGFVLEGTLRMGWSGRRPGSQHSSLEIAWGEIPE